MTYVYCGTRNYGGSLVYKVVINVDVMNCDDV